MLALSEAIMRYRSTSFLASSQPQRRHFFLLVISLSQRAIVGREVGDSRIIPRYPT